MAVLYHGGLGADWGLLSFSWLGSEGHGLFSCSERTDIDSL